MKRIELSLLSVLLICSSVYSQPSIPSGASNFFEERGGLSFSSSKVDILQHIAAGKIDKVESGGGAVDWTEVDGRVFVRAAWIIEIGEISKDLSIFDLERFLAAEMQKKLKSEGFRLTPEKPDLHYIRYRKGSTVGTVEVRSCFLNGGNLPLRYEFIFNEIYRPAKRVRVNGVLKTSRKA